MARRDKDRRRGRRRPAAPWAALILVVGVNCALYSLLQSKKEAARLDASLDATVATRARAGARGRGDGRARWPSGSARRRRRRRRRRGPVLQ